MLSWHNHIDRRWGEPLAQVQADLLWTPSLRQQLANQLAQLELVVDSSATFTNASSRRSPVGFEGTVALVARSVPP